MMEPMAPFSWYAIRDHRLHARALHAMCRVKAFCEPGLFRDINVDWLVLEQLRELADEIAGRPPRGPKMISKS